ncbi:LOW QUALITY PROTEIN: putative serine/threonine-protein kinase mkcB [Vespula maculifrons]|uniref:Serine/threonine-protein kinase mkcB n=1 Tax=Vespula maculifrons TaxID=7453 RepID=A0ABD2B9B3_VESMC
MKTERNNPQPKLPSIHVEAQIIAPLIDLWKEIAKDEYILKQLKDNHVKVQVNAFDTYRKVTKALKEKNANFYTYQPKKDKKLKRDELRDDKLKKQELNMLGCKEDLASGFQSKVIIGLSKDNEDDDDNDNDDDLEDNSSHDDEHRMVSVLFSR